MKIRYENKNKIGDIYLHDFYIDEFAYNDLDRKIKMKLINKYINEELCFKFSQILFCEINGVVKISGEGEEIIDWYEVPAEPQYIDYTKMTLPIGIMLVKASRTSIKIYCEEIEVEGKQEIIDSQARWQNVRRNFAE